MESVSSDSGVIVVMISFISKLKLHISHDNGLGKKNTTYTKDPLLLQLLHDIHKPSKHLCWCRPHSNHHHQNYIERYWLHHYRHHHRSTLMDQDSLKIFFFVFKKTFSQKVSWYKIAGFLEKCKIVSSSTLLWHKI